MVAEVVTEVGMDAGVLSGGNWWSVLLLLKAGDGLVDETEEAFGGGEIGGQGTDVVSRGLWDDRRVSQWVDQQDAGRNGGRVPQVLEDGGEEDGRLGGGDVRSWTSWCQEREVRVDKFSGEFRTFRSVGDGGDEGGIVIPERRGRTTW